MYFDTSQLKKGAMTNNEYNQEHDTMWEYNETKKTYCNIKIIINFKTFSFYLLQAKFPHFTLTL